MVGVVRGHTRGQRLDHDHVPGPVVHVGKPLQEVLSPPETAPRIDKGGEP